MFPSGSLSRMRFSFFEIRFSASYTISLCSMSDDQKGKRNSKPTDNIKVAVRCRPLLTAERQHCEIVCNARKNQIGVVIPKQRGRDSNKLYTFDKVYETMTTQSTLFSQSIDPIISDVLEGYNCTVFCYGQTGSGKICIHKRN